MNQFGEILYGFIYAYNFHNFTNILYRGIKTEFKIGKDISERSTCICVENRISIFEKLQHFALAVKCTLSVIKEYIWTADFICGMCLLWCDILSERNK